MEETQKKDETPKIIVMIVLIVLVIGFVFWRILGAKSQQAPPATVPPPAPLPTTMVASGANGQNVAKPTGITGAERDWTPLDEDQGQGGNYIPVSKSNVFNVPSFKSTEGVIVASHPRGRPPQHWIDNPLYTNPIQNPGQPNRPGAGGMMLPQFHPVEIRVEGVVTGRDGFAMISEGDQTYFRRIGETYDGYRIVKLTQDSVVVRHSIMPTPQMPTPHKKRVAQSIKEIWSVGDKVRLSVPGAAPGVNPQPGRPIMRTSASSTDSSLPDMDATPSKASAPDFAVQAWGGETVKLSDFRGKVVIVDFWATWCGPCQRSMPHLEKVYEAIQGQDVVVLAVCSWDAQGEYEAWIPQHKNYTFRLAFDPAGLDNKKSVASSLYGVKGIPMTVIIDRDGKIIEKVSGYKNNDHRIEDALKKAGITVDAEKAASIR